MVTKNYFFIKELYIPAMMVLVYEIVDTFFVGGSVLDVLSRIDVVFPKFHDMFSEHFLRDR